MQRVSLAGGENCLADPEMETGDYPEIRVYLKAVYPPMAVPLKIDVTTGDSITPGPVSYDCPLLFDGGAFG